MVNKLCVCVAYIPYVSSLTFFKWCLFFAHTKVYLQTQNPRQYRMPFIIFSSFSKELAHLQVFVYSL